MAERRAGGTPACPSTGPDRIGGARRVGYSRNNRSNQPTCRNRGTGQGEKTMIGSWAFQKKVTAGFVVMVGLAVLTAAIAVYTLETVVASKDRLFDVNVHNLKNAEELQAASNEYVAAFRGFLLLTDNRFLEQRRHAAAAFEETDRKSTRLNSSHLGISYAV